MGLMGTSFDVTAILKANVKPFNSGMKEAQMTLQSLKNQTGTILDKLSGSLSAVGTASMKIGAGMTAGLTTPVVGAIGGIVKSFADLEQNLGGTEVVFGSFAKTVQNDAQTAYKNMGLSASDYMATANKMASLFQGSGISQQKSLDLTSQAMQRAADVASVMGIDMSMAMESIAGAAKGNFTMMDNLGVAMNATTLEAYALEKGLNFKWETASNAEKAELAMQMFMDRTKQFDGNFLKESEKTVSGSLGAMKSAFQNFVAGLGNPEADIKQLMVNLKTTVQNFAKNVKTVLLTIWDNLPLEPWQKWVGLIAVSAGPALIAIGGVITVISKFVGTISLISGAVSKVSAWFTLLNSGGSALSLTFAKIVGVVSSLGAPFLVIIGIIAGLIAILVGVYNTSEEFRNKVNSAFEAVKTAITSAIQEAVSFVMELFGALISWWNENHALFEQTATTVWNAIKSVVETVMNVLAPIIETAWNLIVTIVQTAWDVIKTVIQTALNVVLGIIKAVMQIMNGDWSGAWETLKGVAGTIWEGIKSLIQVALDGLVQILQAGMAFLQSIWDAFWNALITFLAPIWEGIKLAVQTGIEAISTFIQTTMSTIQTTWNTVWETIMAFVGPIWTAISETVTTTLTTIWTFIQTGLEFIQSIWSSAWEIIKAVFAAILLVIVGLVTGNFDLIKEAISNAWTIIQEKTSEIWNTITTFLSGIWEGIKSAASAAWKFIKTTISNVMDAIKGSIETAWNAIKDVISNALNNIKSAAENAWNNIKSAISNAIENIKSTVTNGWNNLVSTVTNAGPRIVSAVRNGFDNAVNAARNFISSAISVGRNLIMGFVDGVTSAAGALIDAVGGAVRGAIDWAKGLLGIHSPSRVFRQFGVYTDEGFIIGVNSKAGAVVKSVGNMAQGAIDAFTGKDLAGNLQSELGAVDGELGRLSGYNTSVDFNGGTITVGQQSADIVLKMGNTTYRAFTEDITSAQEMELTLANY